MPSIRTVLIIFSAITLWISLVVLIGNTTFGQAGGGRGEGNDIDFFITPSFNHSYIINDTTDRKQNGMIDVFYGDALTFHAMGEATNTSDETIRWIMRDVLSSYETNHTGKTLGGIVGSDFLYRDLVEGDPVYPEPNSSPREYNVILYVETNNSTVEVMYKLMVHPYAKADFVRPFRLDYSILDATVTLTWRGTPDKAAPAEAHISPSRPVFTFINESESPVPELERKGGIGKVYEIEAVGCFLQDGSPGFIHAFISLPILTSQLEELGNAFLIQEHVRLERYSQVDERFHEVDGSHVIAHHGVKYVVGEVDHFSIFTAIVDSLYNEDNLDHEDVLPDLSVAYIEPSRSAVLPDQELEIGALIKNLGITNAWNVTVDYFVDDEYYGRVMIPLIESSGNDEMAYFTLLISANGLAPSSYAQQIKVVVNAEKSVKEASRNEVDNEKVEMVDLVVPYYNPPPPVIIRPKHDSSVDGTVTIRGRIHDPGYDIRMVYQPFGNNDFAYFVESVEPDAIPVYSINYSLVNPEVSMGHVYRGRLQDIYEINFDDQFTLITYHDNDRDGMVTAGDVFLLKNTWNGGISNSDTTIDFEYGAVDHVEVSVGGGNWTRASGWDDWYLYWDTSTMDDGEYSILARSYDNGQYSTSYQVTMNVNNDGDEDPEVFLSLAIILSVLMITLFMTIRSVIRGPG